MRTRTVKVAYNATQGTLSRFTATDADAWALQVATLSRDFTLLRYHRPATPAHPLPQPAPPPTVAFEVETLWRHLDALPQHGPWRMGPKSHEGISYKSFEGTQIPRGHASPLGLEDMQVL